jgi:HlyD family secretion protein
MLSVLVVGVLLAVALRPAATFVDVATVTRGPIVVTVDEEGETRVRDRFIVSAPVAGRVLRIDLEPGDRVKRGDVVARLRPELPPLLDARARAEARAAIESARATLGRTRAEEQRARAALALAQRELGRARELVKEGLTTSQQVDQREADARTAEDATEAASYAARASASDLVRAEARLDPTGAARADRVVTTTAPIDGLVLKRVRESESVVPAGDPLIELGDPSRLEIVSDLLSTDAVRVKPGARVLVEQWGGDRTLQATVRRVEPSGFTKVSALGVEEQRVNVIADFDDPSEAFAALGDAYRVEVRIVVAEASSVIKVPTSALFRVGEQWAVYQSSEGRARLTFVTPGRRTGQEAEVTQGLAEGATVILHPGDTLGDGSRVVVK